MSTRTCKFHCSAEVLNSGSFHVRIRRVCITHTTIFAMQTMQQNAQKEHSCVYIFLHEATHTHTHTVYLIKFALVFDLCPKWSICRCPSQHVAPTSRYRPKSRKFPEYSLYVIRLDVGFDMHVKYASVHNNKQNPHFGAQVGTTFQIRMEFV